VPSSRDRGVGVPFVQTVALVTIERREFIGLREARSPLRCEARTLIALTLYQRLMSAVAATRQRNRYALPEEYATLMQQWLEKAPRRDAGDE
jgi:hypothetical protein